MGFSTITTVLAAAASANLTDLATVKTELGITSNDTSSDAFLNLAIGQISGSIARHCKRTFVPELVMDQIDVQQDAYPAQTPGGFAQIVLSRWPVIKLNSVVQTLSSTSTLALVADRDFRLDAANGGLLRLNQYTGVGSMWEALPLTITYLAGYGAAASESHSVPGAAPYTVDVAQKAAFSCDLGLVYADGTPLTAVSGSPLAGQYTCNAGTYTFNAADAGMTLAFAYAARAIPDDLVEVALRLITARYKARDRDPALVEQETPGVGRRRWWFGSAPGQKGPFPPDIEAALEEYRMPTLA